VGTGEFVLSLVTVFLGAFLAFLVENFRERRQLRHRVRRDLSHIDELLDEAATAMPAAVARVCRGDPGGRPPPWGDAHSPARPSPVIFASGML